VPRRATDVLEGSSHGTGGCTRYVRHSLNSVDAWSWHSCPCLHWSIYGREKGAHYRIALSIVYLIVLYYCSKPPEKTRQPLQ
jgi:hypothetical protein